MQAPIPKSEEIETWPDRLGDWEVRLLTCGMLHLDGGAMFGSVPRVMWEKMIAPDARHRIPLAMRLLLLRHVAGAPIVLVDCGLGDKFDARFGAMFDVQNPAADEGATPLESVLAREGVRAADVTHVILTHLHFDHAGGVSKRSGAGVEPVFPHAEHFLQRRNLETAERPNPRERASYLPENVEPLSRVRLSLLDGAATVLPGVSVIPSEGHTAGLELVRVEGGGRVLYYVADLAPTSHHLHLPYSMGYDLHAFTIMEEKARLWPRVVEEGAAVVFEHDPTVEAVTLENDKGRFQRRRLVKLGQPRVSP